MFLKIKIYCFETESHSLTQADLKSRTIYPGLLSARVTGASPAPLQEPPCSSAGGHTWGFSHLTPANLQQLLKGKATCVMGVALQCALFCSLGAGCSSVSCSERWGKAVVAELLWELALPCFIRPLSPSYSLSSWRTSASSNGIFSGAVLSAPSTSFISPFHSCSADLTRS